MSNNKRPLISVIIVNFNGEKFLTPCINSLGKEKGNYEIIVVDDGSTDGSRKLLKELNSKLPPRHPALSKERAGSSRSGVSRRVSEADKREHSPASFAESEWSSYAPSLKVVFNKKNLGAAQSRNIGARAARGKYLFFLDNDTEVKAGWYPAILDFFKKHPQDIAQAKLLKMGTKQFDYAGDYFSPLGFLIERARSAKDREQFDKTSKIFGLKSAAMIISKVTFTKLDGFDANYHIFWEDTDIAWRGWLMGYKVFFYPRLVVYHAYGTKKKSPQIYTFNQVTYRGCRNNIATLIKNLETSNLLRILPLNLFAWLLLSLAFLAKGDFHRSRAIIRGISWNITHLAQLLQRRKIIQKQRKISDKELFSQVGSKRDLFYYLGKARAYLTNQPF